MIRFRFAFLAVVLSLAAACTASSSVATDQTRVSVQGGVLSIQNDAAAPVRASESAVPADSLWNLLPTAYERLELAVNHGDPRTRVLGLQDVRVRRVEGNRLSAYLDCGRSVAGPNADTQEVTMSILTQIVPTPNGSEIRIQVEATASNRSNSGNVIPCRSNGRLETRMLEILQSLSA